MATDMNSNRKRKTKNKNGDSRPTIPKWLEFITPGASKAKELKQKSPKAIEKRRKQSR